MSSERRKQFPFAEFEPQWQSYWDQHQSFRTLGPGDEGFDATKPKYYVLDMFPYPSGQGLHVGHPEGYTATDIVARYKRMTGFNVLHPMGWDAFGLPAEQYAIKTGKHPRKTTEENVENFRNQLKRLGFSYDWQREVNTTEPEYFKWTQWIFLQLYNSYCDESGKARSVAELEAQGLSRDEIDARRLAFVSEAPVNWCTELGTVLANEEVIDGKSEVGGFPVERRPMRQWMLRITAFAQRLIDELDGLDWPEGIKLLQRNWIGRSDGAEVVFQIEGHADSVTVFTTRPDTLFGATYMVLSPEHPLLNVITPEDRLPEVKAYQKLVSSKSDLERTELAKDKTGVFTGAYAINPVNEERIPIWIADYVLMTYGTGAIMAVPAHDERDFEFAQKFALPIKEVVQNPSADMPASAGKSGVWSPDVPSGSSYLNEHASVDKSHRNLPHWQQDGKLYFFTWRLADSLPQEKLKQLKAERDSWVSANRAPTEEQTAKYQAERFEQLDSWLDAGEGSCLLRRPEAASVVAGALHHFNGERYELEAFVVMPNHVHVLARIKEGEDVSKLLHSWKSYTAKELNKLTGGEGTVWQEESFDRIIRSKDHELFTRQYIRENPAVAKLRDGESVLFERGKADGVGGLVDDTGGTPVLHTKLFSGDGIAINSDFLDGFSTYQAKRMITGWLEERKLGKAKVNFKLRDWLFSRQRYWGEPFPILWEDGYHTGVPEGELPVIPPDLADFKPTGTPEPPLSKAPDWVKYSETATRELNTMPQWAGSCWYYLRYCDPKNATRFISKEADAYWMGSNGQPGGVDLYVGGTEHAVLHLLYARFWHKVLFDLGHVTTPEPFQRLVNQGLIMGEDGQKMSKSRGNVVNPDDVILEYGADSLRLYEMFMGPLEQVKPWQMKGVEGVYRFLGRVWRLVMEDNQEGEWIISPKLQDVPIDKSLNKVLHETIKKVGEDIEKLSFNTAISQMMVLTKAFTQPDIRPVAGIVGLLRVLNPFAPHLTEELASRILAVFPRKAADTLLSHQGWPAYDPAALIVDDVEIVFQVNGKLRDRSTVTRDTAKEELEALALANERVQEFTAGLTVRKVVIVPNKLVNIVAN